MFDADIVLPPRGVLLHIGPHKTGTTAVQSSFHAARKRLAREGILYAGKDRQPMRAAIAVTTGRVSHGAMTADMKFWRRISRQVQRADQRRVVVSSEFFCEADDDAARTIVEGLGGDRVHVVVTLRPLAMILPSQWQQYIQNGMRRPYDEWLDIVFNRPRYSRPSPMFWRRHDHGELVERWAGIVGPQRMVVLIADEGDRGSLLRGFERMLRLEEGFLVPEASSANRSLSIGEVEMVRLLNAEFKKRGWMNEHYHALMRHGVIKHVLRHGTGSAGEPRMSTPGWALERASDAGAEAAKRIAATGVHVVGDLSGLAAIPPAAEQIRNDDEPLPARPVTSVTAAEAVVGAILGSGATGHTAARKVKFQTVGETSSRDLLKILRRRARRRIARPSRR